MSVVASHPRDTLAPLIETELRRWVGHGDNLLELACLDALFPPGKLLRPILCIESARAVGGDTDQVLSFAAGVECMHAASLIHDDIVDQEPVRRGRASTAENFGIAEAVVAGDGLSMTGYAAMLGTSGPADRVLEASRVAIAGLRRMCHGMMRETEIREDPSCGLPVVLEVIRGKTAALISASCQAGAILGGATPAQADALRQYGELLGTAFQIRDDLLPYTADERDVGKTALSDVANRQPTLPVLLAHEAAGDADRRRLTEIFRYDVDPAAAHRDVLDIMTRTGAIEQAVRLAQEYVDDARAALAAVPRPDRLADLAVAAVDLHL